MAIRRLLVCGVLGFLMAAQAHADDGDDDGGGDGGGGGGDDGDPQAAASCSKADLGSIEVKSLDGNLSQDGVYAQAEARLAVKEGKAGCCSKYRWIQVGQVTPPLKLPAGSPLAKNALKTAPWVDGHAGGVPYYTFDTGDQAGKESGKRETEFFDDPRLEVSHGADKRVTFDLEVALICIKSGSGKEPTTERIVESIGWGFSFGDGGVYTFTKLDPPARKNVTSFWKTGVANDFPSYPYQEK